MHELTKMCNLNAEQTKFVLVKSINVNAVVACTTYGISAIYHVRAAKLKIWDLRDHTGINI